MKRMRNDPDILEEYDFRGGVRGKYAKQYAQGAVSVSPSDKGEGEILPLPRQYENG
jgi:hypothetical protein